MCHDNAINTKYLKEIIDLLESEDYEFVSIKDAIMDTAYSQRNVYFKKWGISWFYRWMPDSNHRKEWMKREPDMSDIESLYNTIFK